MNLSQNFTSSKFRIDKRNFHSTLLNKNTISLTLQNLKGYNIKFSLRNCDHVHPTVSLLILKFILRTFINFASIIMISRKYLR